MNNFEAGIIGLLRIYSKSIKPVMFYTFLFGPDLVKQYDLTGTLCFIVHNQFYKFAAGFYQVDYFIVYQRTLIDNNVTRIITYCLG